MTPNPRVALVALALVAAGGCTDPTQPTLEGEQIGVVLNSIESSLSLFADTGDAVLTVGLAPEGTPVGLSVRGARALVPLGLLPAAVIVDLATASVIDTIALPDGSGATGSAFVDDTLALVANPGLNTVSPVDLTDGTARPQIAVGTWPQAIAVAAGRVFVLNAELVNFTPARTGTVTVLDAVTLAFRTTIELSGENPQEAAVGADGRLYVINAGRFGGGSGSLSVVDPVAEIEVAHHGGFGEFPGSITAGPDGRLYVGAFAYGVAVWDPATSSFVRPPSNPIPGVSPPSPDVAFDADGRLHVLRPVCDAPGSVARLAGNHAVERELDVGTCPVAIAFATLPAD